MSIKYVAIIQCDIAQKRCSGFACTNAFYNREDAFSSYDDSVKYISFTCGGCCGKGVASKLEHLTKKLRTKNGIDRDEVAVHMSSCMTTDNYHYDRCPHAEYIKNIILKKGYKNLTEGSFISKNAEKKRESGEYNCY